MTRYGASPAPSPIWTDPSRSTKRTWPRRCADRTHSVARRDIDLDSGGRDEAVSFRYTEAEAGGKTMTPRQYDRVAIKVAVPEHGLRAGDVATLVDFVDHPLAGPRGCVL